MANTLTSLIPDLYESLDVISRELVGFIPAVNTDHNVSRAALGEIVRSFVAPSTTLANIAPAQYAPNDGDQIIGNVAVSISKSMYAPIRWNGEEQKGVNFGPGYSNIKVKQIVQGMRAFVNQMEVDLGTAARAGSSRATGTAGSTPFASNLTDPAQCRKILSDNGAPLTDLHLVADTTSGAALRTLTQLTNVNQAGTADMLRNGVLFDVHGFAIRESAGVQAGIAVGTGAGYTSSAAGFAVGTTAIPIITGAGTVLAGDVITFAGDTNKYVVSVGVAAPGTITLAAPGLRKAIPAAATALTIGAIYTANMAFDRNAIILVTRMPALPAEGDMADDAVTVTDPLSGLSFELRMYKQYRQVKYELGCAWGTAVVKANHIVTLLG